MKAIWWSVTQLFMDLHLVERDVFLVYSEQELSEKAIFGSLFFSVWHSLVQSFHLHEELYPFTNEELANEHHQ